LATCRWDRERVRARIAEGLQNPPSARPCQGARLPAIAEILDGREILSLITRAAQGDPAAEYTIASWMEDGHGRFGRDPVAARNLYLDAAMKGHGGAQFSQGYFCLKGIGGKADPVAAVKWFRRSAAQGDERAQYWMGRCCQGGVGSAGDRYEAIGWYRMAADRSTGAQVCLGIAYALGMELPKDISEAFVWFWVSAAGGDDAAPKLLQEVADEMPTESLEQALSRAKVELNRIQAKAQRWPAASPGSPR
jgi:TPR repeat protein